MDQWVPRAHLAKFYGRLRLIRSVLRASNFSVLKLIQIVILWVYCTIPFGFSLFWHFLGITFQLLNYFVWLRITDEVSVPEMRIWSILLMKSDLKWYITDFIVRGPSAFRLSIDVIYYRYQNFVWTNRTIINFILALSDMLNDRSVKSSITC